ncbi:hypothetical protein M3B46_10045 [Sphingobacterium daejeonense]|uniref:hypothetical protein n=1 Tax=Sphingobacterium daejeonense TaxID=371142 RepID=UPI0021A751AD|nr:hypothetical protein [Sphingobacterium daejeonense]MCT1531337.1 hypothetical protein [Sphingobacterium daejeonense]
MKSTPPIRTYIINLEKRKDRLNHVLDQFSLYEIFDLQVFTAIEREKGSYGLWLTIRSIIKNCLESKLPYVLIVEDDHTFTKDFTEQGLIEAIEIAQQNNAELLSGGVSWFDFTVKVDKGLNWINSFTGFQFIVLFNNLFTKLLETDLEDHEVTDKKISSIAKKKFCVFPFFSIQTEFGYSDITKGNEESGTVSNYFINTSKRFSLINKVYDFYKR